jgi:type II secretory pathway pseudopilin PulG
VGTRKNQLKYFSNKMEEIIMRHVRHPQLGIALLLILTMIIVGAASMILYKLNHVNFQTTNQDKTAQALAQAKDALIGFALAYAENHPGQPQGYLPCPDKDGDGSSTTCGTTGTSALGRLPWRTLGLPPLRDGSGECLWYAVSGTYKDKPKQTLTSDTNGLFVVNDANSNTLAGTTPADQAIAIIFAPGLKIGTQHREATGTRTVCGSNNTTDAINQAANYLDSLNGINNAISPPAQFISAPVTKQASDPSQVLFNDTLMLITPKDFEPAYKRMNQWVAAQVKRCLVKYSNQYQSALMNKYEENVIGKWDNPKDDTYRKKHSNDIKEYVNTHLVAYKTNYEAQHDGKDPSDQEIEAKTNSLLQNAVVISDKYPWASKLDNTALPDYVDDSGERFGRIPSSPLTPPLTPLANTHNDNSDMSDSWPEYSPPGRPAASSFNSICGTPLCFGENQSSCSGGGRDKDWYWWWWDEWKEMVFYAVENNNSPTTPTYIWIPGQTSTTEGQTSTTEVLPDLIHATPTNTLKLDSSNAQVVVLVAGRKLSTQTRESNADKGNAGKYLEGGNETFTSGTEEKFVSKSTPGTLFNDIVNYSIVCNQNTCPLP